MVIDGVRIMVLLLMVHVIVSCHLLSIVVDFILLFSIYIVFYFELADDNYSVRIPYTDPYLYFSFVICGVQQTCQQLRLVRNSSQSSTYRISG